MATQVIRNSNFKPVSAFTKLDGKKRVTLGIASKVLPASSGYAIYLNEMGQILLDPVSVVPVAEKWLYENKASLASVLKGIKEAGDGKTKKINLKDLAPLD